MDFFVVSTEFDEISYYKYNGVPLTLLIYSLSDKTVNNMEKLASNLIKSTTD